MRLVYGFSRSLEQQIVLLDIDLSTLVEIELLLAHRLLQIRSSKLR